jgi:HSP20 family protein
MDLRALAPSRNEPKPQVTGGREDSLDPFVVFRREIDRIFGGFFDAYGRTGRALSGWSNLTPTMDLVENEKDIVISAELPGLDEKDFEVTVAGDLLTLKGEKKTRQEERKGNSTYTERRYDSFSRSVRLPFEVKDEAVEASYEKGVLTVRVPKPAGLQPAVRIEVKRG